MADIFDRVHSEARGDVFDQLHTEATKSQTGPVGRFIGGLWDTTVGGLKDTALALADLTSQLGPGGRGFDPNSVGGKAAMGIVQGHIDQAKKAKDALDQGRYSEAIGHSLATILPLVGPAAAHAGERIGEGDVAGGLGEATGLVGMSMAPAGARAVRSKLPAAVKISPAIKSKLNPVEQSALGLLQERGVPLTPGTVSGNRFVRSAEAVTRHSPLGAEAAEDFARSTEQGLQRVAGELANEVHPTPATPESAGRSMTKKLQEGIETFSLREDAAYKDAWKGRDDPRFTRDLPVRTERKPVLGQDGNPTGDLMEHTVTRRVNMPVDIREIKDLAGPIQEELKWALSRADQNSSLAFNALEKILSGDDYIPAWQAERGLSALKTMARVTNQSGVRNTSQGVAASLIPQLQEAVDAAVAQTGEGAMKALQRGRALHANKMEVVQVADQLAAEPVQNFGKATWRNDTGIEFLWQLDKHGVNVPEIGRAFVDQLFDKATREGGFAKARTILSEWQNLGPESKKLMFPDPRVRESLNRFFKAAEMVGQTPNPSGTALVNQATSLNPLRWLAGYAGSKLLFTPQGASILTEGLRLPLRGQAGAAIAENSMQAYAKQLGNTAARGAVALLGEDEKPQE